MALTEWMKRYQDRTLGEMILPGAHDAGTAKDYIDLTSLGTKSNSATQQLTITEMLVAGTRFFDLRLAEHGGKVVAHHTTQNHGAYSQISVDRVLETAALWCSMYRSEVVVLRISHTKASTNVHEIIKASCAKHGVLHTGTGNLVTKTLGEITSKGGLICILDTKNFAGQINQGEGIHAYTKYGGNPMPNGIMTCGCYSSTHSLQQVVCNGLQGMYEHNDTHIDPHKHLWQVYWQKTYFNPASWTGIEDGTKKRFTLDDKEVHGGTHQATGYLLGLMSGQRRVLNEDFVVAVTKSKGLFKRGKKVLFSSLALRQLRLPNIISYDFVNEDTNLEIIQMNEKGLQAHLD